MQTIDTIRRSGIAVDGGTPIRDAAQLMDQSGVGSLAVLDGTPVVGIVTDRDLVRRGLAKGLDPAARIDAVMSTPPITIRADSDVRDAYAVFRSNAVRRLLVMDRDDFVGVLTIDDLLVNLAADLADLARPITAETVFGQRDPAVPALT